MIYRHVQSAEFIIAKPVREIKCSFDLERRSNLSATFLLQLTAVSPLPRNNCEDESHDFPLDVNLDMTLLGMLDRCIKEARTVFTEQEVLDSKSSWMFFGAVMKDRCKDSLQKWLSS